jgi:hypothetical protein
MVGIPLSPFVESILASWPDGPHFLSDRQPKNGDGHLTNLPIRGTEALVDGESEISNKPSWKLGQRATNHEKWTDFQNADQSPIGCAR